MAIDSNLVDPHEQNTDTKLDEDGTNEISASEIVKCGVGIIIDGGGSELSTGSSGFAVVPFAGSITEVILLADQSGSIVIDIKKSTYSGFPTTSSITASAKPTLSSAQKYSDTTLTGWTKAVSAGDVLEFIVDSVTTITRCSIVLKIKKG